MACMECFRVSNHRLLYACIGFVISYTVLVYCILDLAWIGALPPWSAMSTLTFIVGLWAVSPGQGLMDGGKSTRKPPKPGTPRVRRR